MEASAQMKYANELRNILNLESRQLGLKLSSIIDLGGAMDIVGRYGYRQAIGYFVLTRESTVKKKLLWFEINRLNIEEIASMAVYRSGTLEVFVDDPSFNTQAESIARAFEESTEKQTVVHLK